MADDSGKASEEAPFDAAQAEPGSPIPEGAIDSELTRLPVPRTPRSPLLALSVVALGLLLAYKLRADLRYALQPNTPTDIEIQGPKAGHLQEETYVRISGLPDHRNTLSFDAKGERNQSHFFRLLGTGSRVLVVTDNPMDRTDLANRFVGRVRRFDDMAYAETIRDYYKREGQALRALDLGKVAALKPGPLAPPLTLSDRVGESLRVAASDPIYLTVRMPRDVRVLALKTKFPSEPDARHEILRLGVPTAPANESKDGYGYVLRVEESGMASLIAKLEAQGLLFQQRVEFFKTSLAALQIGQGGLVVEKGPSVPVVYDLAPQAPAEQPPKQPPSLVEATGPTVFSWNDVLAFQVAEPVLIASDSVVVLTGAGNTPKDLRWTLYLMGLVCIFVGFNLWYLFGAVRKT